MISRSARCSEPSEDTAPDQPSGRLGLRWFAEAGGAVCCGWHCVTAKVVLEDHVDEVFLAGGGRGDSDRPDRGGCGGCLAVSRHGCCCSSPGSGAGRRPAEVYRQLLWIL